MFMKLKYPKFVVGGVLFFANFGFAQVGVNTTTPHAQLDVVASNQATPSPTDGLLVPRVDNFPVTNPSVNQQGMLVYLTTTVGTNLPGFYYWENVSSTWKSIAVSSSSTTDWSTTGNAGTSSGTHFIGTTDNQALDIRTNNSIKVRITTKGQIEVLNTGQSVFIGENAGANDDLTNNQSTFVGFESGKNNTTGSGNTFVGQNSGNSNTTGDANVFVGRNAGRSNTSGTWNNAFGDSTLQNNTTGNHNVALGRAALASNTTGASNIGIGRLAMGSRTTGSNNTVVGDMAFWLNNNGNNNVSLGAANGSNNTTGTNNTFLGHNSGFNNNGSFNVFLGYQSGYNETGSDKLYIANSNTANPLIYGDFASSLLKVNGTLNVNNAYNLPTTTGTANQVLQTDGAGTTSWVDATTLANNSWSILGNSGTVNGTNFIGTTDNVPLTFRVNNERSGLISNATASSTFFGYQAGGTGTATGNSAFGHQSLFGLTTGTSNTANGFQSLYANTTGISNTAIGYRTLYNNVSGNQNVAIGNQALNSNTGNTNTAVGSIALFTNTTGNNNVSLGYRALYGNISGSQNVGLGTESLIGNTSGGNNVAVGYRALYSNTTTFNNNALGSSSLQNNTTGTLNNAFGTSALFTNVSGSNNVAFGHQAGYLSTGNRNVFLGYQSGYNETGSDKLYIANSNTANPLIYGDFASSLLKVNGTLNVNNAYNLPTTTGTANQVLQTNGAGVTSWVNPSSLTITETDPQVSSTTTNYIPKWNGTTLVDGQVFDNGMNVGVGTATPATRFHIASDNTATNTTIESGNQQYPTALHILPSSHTNSRRSTIKLDDWSILQDVTGTGTKDFTIYQGATTQQRLTINTSGNVGVGINNPTEKLEVNGKTKTTNIQVTNGATNGYVLQSDATGNGTWVNPSTLSITETDPQVSSTTLNYIPKWNGTTLTDGTITDNGNIGIGTTTPTNKLEVVGTISTTGFQMTSGATAGYILQSNASGNATWINPTSLAITEVDPQVSSTTTNYIPKWNGTSLVDGQLFDNGINVGIGTTSPSDKVHVVGNIKVDGGKIPFVNTGNSVFIGENAGINDDYTANNNTFIGNSAGRNTTTGSNNVALGIDALRNNTTTSSNVAIGAYALSNASGASNIGIGYNTLNSATGLYNISIGIQSGQGLTSGNSNLFLGFNSGKSTTTGGGNVFLGYNSGTNNVTGQNNVFIGNYSGANETGSDKLYIDNSNTTTPLVYGDFSSDVLTVNGNLGVGTTTPTQAKLVVNGSANLSLASYGYLNSSGTTGSFTGPATNAYSIYASNRIAASEFNAFSDARIKNILSRTNTKTDLETLAKIRITNYKHIDTISNPNKVIKKVIAQELKEVFPNAVSTHVDFIPNVYKLSELTNGKILVANDFKVGDKVKLIFADQEEIVEVLSANATQFVINSTKTGKVFVYGKQVTDFHTVDYEALSTLNISATQELLKRIEELNTRLNASENENNKLKAQVDSFEQVKSDVEMLKKMLLDPNTTKVETVSKN